MLRTTSFLLLSAFAVSAHADGFDKAKQHMELAAARQCELTELQLGTRGLAPDSQAYREAATRLMQRGIEARRERDANIMRMRAIGLPANRQQPLDREYNAIVAACTEKAMKGSASTQPPATR